MADFDKEFKNELEQKIKKQLEDLKKKLEDKQNKTDEKVANPAKEFINALDTAGLS